MVVLITSPSAEVEEEAKELEEGLEPEVIEKSKKKKRKTNSLFLKIIKERIADPLFITNWRQFLCYASCYPPKVDTVEIFIMDNRF